MRGDGVNIKAEICREFSPRKLVGAQRAAAGNAIDERHSFAPGPTFVGSV
jgi:hypothetical protein